MRRLLAIILLITLIATAAYAVSTELSVTLVASQPVATQVKTFVEYLHQLPQSQQDQWFAEIGILVNERQVFRAATLFGSYEDTVYVTTNGERYHQVLNCRGLRNANEISAVTKEVAVAMGRTPCKLCYPGGDK